MIDLEGTPYGLDDEDAPFLKRLFELSEQVALLRAEGTLRPETLRAYFGDRRFEEVAESNAIEGSTLGVRETELAVARGITISGHDPAYTRDAINLAAALERMVELAQLDRPTDLEQVKDIHSVILGDRAGAGVLRSEPIRISGSDHRPPKTWEAVMEAMGQWEDWSQRNVSAPPLLRAVVLHTWLTHIHPFMDGNGRTARAIMNLELIRSGYPSIILRKKDRVRYYEALAESDSGGDLAAIGDLISERGKHAVRGLAAAARSEQGYDEVRTRLRQSQARQVGIWNDAVRLLFSLTEDALQRTFGDMGTAKSRWYDSDLRLEDYLALVNNDSSGNSWVFGFDVSIPAVGGVSYLAWTGFRSDRLRRVGSIGPGASLFWSVHDESGRHYWVRRDEAAPGGSELTLEVPDVDRWIVRHRDGKVDKHTPSALAGLIVQDVGKRLVPED